MHCSPSLLDKDILHLQFCCPFILICRNLTISCINSEVYIKSVLCACVNKWMYGCLLVFYVCCVQECSVVSSPAPSRCPLLCMCALPLPNLQEIWMATGGTTRLGIAVRPPQCLWWDMRGPALTLTPTHPSPFSLFIPVCLSSQTPRVFSHFMFPSLYLHLCMLFFFLFFIPHL